MDNIEHISSGLNKAKLSTTPELEGAVVKLSIDAARLGITGAKAEQISSSASAVVEHISGKTKAFSREEIFVSTFGSILDAIEKGKYEVGKSTVADVYLTQFGDLRATEHWKISKDGRPYLYGHFFYSYVKGEMYEQVLAGDSRRIVLLRPQRLWWSDRFLARRERGGRARGEA